MARLVDPRRGGVPRFRGGPHGEPMIRRPRETSLLLLAFGMAIVPIFISIYLLAELEKDVVNVYCSSGLHVDPCYTEFAWSAAERGILTCGGEYASLLGYCFEPGEYEGRRGVTFGSSSLAYLRILRARNSSQGAKR